MSYELKLASTGSGVGYFACLPARQASFDECLAYLRLCPLDDFMHRSLLDRLCGLEPETLAAILDAAWGRDPIVVALVCEACLSVEKFEGLRSRFDREARRGLLPHSPLIILKSSLLGDQDLHARWGALFGSNLGQHRPLPHPETTGLPLLFPREVLAGLPRARMSLGPFVAPASSRAQHAAAPHPPGGGDEAPGRKSEAVGARSKIPGGAPSLPSPEETAIRALERLGAIGGLAGPEMKHVSSLSPHGFYRRWHLRLGVKNGRHDHTVTGIQTSYGKGLTEAVARASYAMEMVERVSSFASFGPEGVLGTARALPLVQGRFSELAASGRDLLDPNALRLEAPYEDEPLYWLEAAERRLDGTVRPVLIPAQAVFLFCNLDEIGLFSGLGSTGLASGNTLEQARVSALLEVLERDGEATTVHDPARCFRITADDPLLGPLLAHLGSRGVQVRFQDLTGSLGVPCVKSFVVTARGEVFKGTGAHLDGRKAVVSALTETPFAHQGASRSGPGIEGLVTVRYEDLPNHGTGDPAADLETLEDLLLGNGFRVLYVDLTRQDLGIPVVKAIVPGLEFMADFDAHSRVSPRLFADYLRMLGLL